MQLQQKLDAYLCVLGFKDDTDVLWKFGADIPHYNCKNLEHESLNVKNSRSWAPVQHACDSKAPPPRYCANPAVVGEVNQPLTKQLIA